MSGSFDVARALDGGISDRERAWTFIRSFAAAWGDALAEDDGTPRAELAQAEAMLGCSLPTALHEFYTLVGSRPDLVANQEPLLPPHEVFVHDECGGVLVFRSENQGCAFWGVRLTDLDRDDPPVLVQARHGWGPFLDRVSLSCVELVLSEALFGGGGRLYNACELPADLLGAVPEHFQRVQLPDRPMWTGREEFPVRWFSAPGKLLRQDGLGVHSWLHVRGRTRADLDAICAAVPERWSLGYTESLSSEPLPF
ncbi:SMI1/KNR4 family protein [Streptomyces broussonetiae]|uniref:SMI1/KNR4 family protein n=1 Tax=Streptomyces broussonetiae TaxID=2686304 RepID=A0A6I6MPS3_9ACTN|nr:SMI1/KNR4 family protein [Streptomyces broussonetiae]QHA02243.1 SMI1/KNR4 family protein [Streptomyces broussonetiae]